MTEPRRVRIDPEREPGASESPRGSSKEFIFFLQIAYLIALGFFVVAYRVHWIEPRPNFFGPVPFLVPWFGAVGAALLSLSAVFEKRGPAWDVEYRFWHWARPLVGAIVATVTVLILQSGILAVGGQTPNQTDSSGSTKNLLYYVFAFIVGYREEIFRQLIKRLADVILTPPAQTGVAPVIASIEPSEAVAGRETAVKLTGSGFTEATSVTLGGESVQFASASDTQMTVTVPATAQSGPTSLVVTTQQGIATASFTIT